MTGWIESDRWAERARELRDEGWMLMDLCGLDRSGLGRSVVNAGGAGTAGAGFRNAEGTGGLYGPRFEVVVQLLHALKKERMTLHVNAAGDPPTVPSVVEVWPTANFLEREAFDMFGIQFEGHPHLTRILMPDDWEGHPLRKDYGVGKVPVEFISQPLMQIDSPGQSPETVAAERSVDELGQSGPPLRTVEEG
ncbi:MAG: NADH-quinone oxidoreductase subunit C [Actinobacteria bacterium]|nr:NADH-quinone oxidoreductase subunit C [Actinomycetota bacterium]